MNKELLVAIGIGALLGLGVAIYLNNVPTGKTPSVQVNSEQISVTPKKLTNKQTVFKDIPRPNEVRTKGTLSIKGESSDDTTLFIQTIQETIPVTVKNSVFSKDVTLKPGYNEIIISSKRKNGDQVKVLKFFYLQQQAAVTPLPTEAQATSEAALLKQKLEKKVLELRANAQKAFYGTIQSIGEKELLLKNDADSLKVALEPEVTKFYGVEGTELEEIEVTDLEKGDLITVFLSDIGGEVKSYTMYREPKSVLVAGKLSNITDANYELTMINYEKTTLKADIDTGTQQQAYSIASKETVKYGFSKLKIGDAIFAVLNPNPDKSYTLERYLVVNEK